MNEGRGEMADYIEWWETSGEFFWHAKSNNNDVLADGGGYNNKEDLMNALKAMFPTKEIKMKLLT